jgi:hypothetical protein
MALFVRGFRTGGTTIRFAITLWQQDTFTSAEEVHLSGVCGK